MSSKTPSELEKLINTPALLEALSDISNEYKERLAYNPPKCSIFKKEFLTIKDMKQYTFSIDLNAKKKLNNILQTKVQHLVEANKILKNEKYNLKKKLKIGIVFSGGPSPGGHNVIAGLFDALKKSNNRSSLFGFVMGPNGMIEGNYVKLTQNLVNRYRNLGGFNIIKTGRTKIDTPRKVDLLKTTCKKLGLNAIVIVGGDDSNTNAVFLAQEMFHEKISIIGVPKTIDGDVQVKDLNDKTLCATSFGFHTAAKAFSCFVSNLCTDAGSDVKYWHICKVMGRTASHLALEVAFQTHPNLTLIGEELADYIDHRKLNNRTVGDVVDYSAYGISLDGLVSLICSAITERAKIGKNFGVIVVPEGILEFINEIQILIIKLNSIIVNYNSVNTLGFHTTFNSLRQKLEYLDSLTTSENNSSLYLIWNTKNNNLFLSMPSMLQKGLLTKRDSHGNFQFSQVQTEKIILDLVKKKLISLQKQGKYTIGIDKRDYDKLMENKGFDKDLYGSVLFRNWNKGKHLLFHEKIISKSMLVQALIKSNIINNSDNLPEPILKIFEKSIPDFKAQTHFYGYDGRGSNPTHFDCTYAYNLGYTAFHLVNNGATGQMACILNLDNGFTQWEPIGIPIAPLMHLEERKGKLTLVLKKTMVDLKSPAFKIFKELRVKWLGSNQDIDHYKMTDSIQFTREKRDERPITLLINRKAKK